MTTAETTAAETLHIGIDVSKQNLDTSLPGSPRFENSAAGIRRLLGDAAKAANGRALLLCCEATGGYEQQLC